jgi:hypothetical protein
MNNYWDLLKSSSLKSIVSAPFHEFVRSAPDSLFLGSILLSIFTQSFPLIVLSLAMGEIGILHRALAFIFDSVSDNLKTQGPEICRIGIPSPYQFSLVGNLVKEYAFPNGTLFFLSAVIVYISSSITQFTDEFNELSKISGQESYWNSRTILSSIFSVLLLIIFLLYNVLYGCVNVIPALGSIAIGSLVGMGILFLNKSLFGKQGINFLGIPILENRKIINLRVLRDYLYTTSPAGIEQAKKAGGVDPLPTS